MITSPNLKAVICDGMGWFSETDYKRALLVYEEIEYLIPDQIVEFEDVTGKRQVVFFPDKLNPRKKPYQIGHYQPTNEYIDILFSAAQADASLPGFSQVIESIPEYDRLYTWRVVNGDGDLGQGCSLALKPDQVIHAHALLLNKFLLAADKLGAIPITGKPYVRKLMEIKYRNAAQVLQELDPMAEFFGNPQSLRHDPVVAQIVSAFISDEELASRSNEEISAFKEKHQEHFAKFSYTVRQMVAKIATLPPSSNFAKDLTNLAQTEVWREKKKIEDDLKAGWDRFFRTTIKTSVGGLLSMGVIPFLSLGELTLASAISAGAAITPWAVSELLALGESRKKAGKNGQYYLLNFKG